MDYSTSYMIQDIFAYLFYWYLNYTLVMRIAIITIIILIIVYVILAVNIVAKERYRNRRKKIRANLEENYIPYIRNIITDNTKRYTRQEVRKKLNLENKDFKVIEFRVLMELMFDLMHECRHLSTFSYYNLRVVSESIKMGDFMEKELVYGTIRRKYLVLTYAVSFCLFIDIPEKSLKHLLLSRVSELRRLTKITLILIKDSDPFKYLREDFDKDFCKWDMMQLHYIFELRKSEGRPIPNFEDFYRESSNPLMRIFIVNEIALFKQVNSIPFLMDILVLLYRPRLVPKTDLEIELTKAVITALGSMHYVEMETVLRDNYNTNSEEIRLVIIEAMGEISSGESLEFLSSIFALESKELKIAIARAIYADKNRGEAILDTMEKNADEFGKLVIAQVKSPLL